MSKCNNQIKDISSTVTTVRYRPNNVHKQHYCCRNTNTMVAKILYHLHFVLNKNRTARRQFQATGQPVSRTQADAMTSRLPCYEAKCVQRRCFQCGPVPLRSDIKGTEPPPANILIPLERQFIALQPCR